MKHIRTSQKDHERFHDIVEKEVLPAHEVLIHIDQHEKMQTILGFGGAFTEASAYNLSRINKVEREKAIKAYFDPVDGLGYTLGRVSIHGCDFSLGSYLYIDDFDDSLNSFSIKRDQPILDLIIDASKIRGQKIQILASPWTPPFWMKDNKSPIRGGKLLPEYDQIWANYFVKFIEAYQNAGVDVFSVTIQNEPAAVQRWDSCIYEAEDEARFAKVLGKTFKDHKLDTKIYIWDHNRDLMVERAKKTLEDKEASNYIYGIAFHWYDPEMFDEVKKTHDLFPDKHLIFTEGCQENGPHPLEYKVGERYGRNIINDFRNYNEGYIDWNLFLDDTGGPNHVNNLCSAPILLNIFHEEIVKNPSYYYIGHLSKYVMPGAKQIKSEGTKEVIYVAFINPDGKKVIVIQNESEADKKVSIQGLEEEISILSKAHSISTLII